MKFIWNRSITLPTSNEGIKFYVAFFFSISYFHSFQLMTIVHSTQSWELFCLNYHIFRFWMWTHCNCIVIEREPSVKNGTNSIFEATKNLHETCVRAYQIGTLKLLYLYNQNYSLLRIHSEGSLLSACCEINSTNVFAIRKTQNESINYIFVIFKTL